ncbi:MAG: UDP-N-acetylmuramoyl-tripeptide--D-alanyl-D-alanine ligase [Clostridiales bacterium]|nr:UDP-N-acetylmuramoyl-tripeptide--D-alanyl-D-alanine ligase [Clostridiales bacterium]
MMTLQEILDATKGQLVNFPESMSPSEYTIESVSTDTRTISEGDLFLALIGEKFDGHAYTVQAVQDGARALVVSSLEQVPEQVPSVLVSDTKIALENIAAYYREKIGCKVVAVTGSVGKTSTREMIACALSAGTKVYATKNNENNEIGLSKTILAAPADTKVIVLEMGMRLRGEISELTHIAKPDVTVITNIGVAHIERLGSRDEILNAKLEILEGLKEDGLLIIPASDEMLKIALSDGRIGPDVKVAFTASEKDEIPSRACGKAVAGDPYFAGGWMHFSADAGFDTMQQMDLKLSTIGLHHVGNALAGILCGLYLGIAPNLLCEGVASFCQVGHRERLVEVEGVHFLDDSYNAGPESMMSAYTSIRRLAGSGRAFACVADMLELGDVSSEMHFNTGVKAAQEKLDGVLVLGRFKEDVKAGIRSVDAELPVICCEDKPQMVEELKKLVKPGDFVLLKASHSFMMYTILEEYASIFKEGGRGQ